jgi:hypothetical protein
VEIAGSPAGPDQDQPRSRGRFMKGASGNPSGRQAVRSRAAELFAAMAADFGELNGIDAAMLNQACLLLARAERIKAIKHADASVRMSSEARRLVETLRRHHVAPKAPVAETFAEVAARAQAEASARRELELAEDDVAEPVGEAQPETAIPLPGDSEIECSGLQSGADGSSPDDAA